MLHQREVFEVEKGRRGVGGGEREGKSNKVSCQFVSLTVCGSFAYICETAIRIRISLALTMSDFFPPSPPLPPK